MGHCANFADFPRATNRSHGDVDGDACSGDVLLISARSLDRSRGDGDVTVVTALSLGDVSLSHRSHGSTEWDSNGDCTALSGTATALSAPAAQTRTFIIDHHRC